MLNNNFKLFKIYKFFNGLEPLSVFMIIYFYQITGSFATAIAVRSMHTITCSLTEIPVGLISDNIGRKKTLITTAIFMTLCSFFYALGGTIESLPILMLGGCMGGLSNSFYSGSFEAMIYETCVQTDKKHNFASTIASAGAYRHSALAIGTLIALGVSHFFGLTALAWVAVIPNLGEIATSLFFHEPMCPRPDRTNPWTMLKNSIKDFAKSAKLRSISILEVFDFSLHWTNLSINGLYFQSLAPLWVINIATFLKHIASTLGFNGFHKFKHSNMFKILTVSNSAEAFIGLITIIANCILSPFIWAFASFFESFKEPAASSLIQHELNPQQRATMGSLISIFGGISAGTMMYLVGLVADHTSIFVGFSLLITGKLSISFLYHLLGKRYT